MTDEERLLKEKYNGKKSEAFFADCKRLAFGEPLAYLIGHSPFLDCTIYLDSKPLIPRPETEYWVKEAITTITNSQTSSLGITDSTVRILDLCAGSGCIGVATLNAIPSALVDFVEIDAAHLETIHKNCRENKINTDRITIIHGTLFSKTTQTYDFILSNPPYIDEALHRVDESVTLNEPHLALFGGRGGVDIIAQIIAAAPAHLRSGGQLWLEHEPEQSAIIARLAEAAGFNCQTHQDQYGTERYSILVLQ